MKTILLVGLISLIANLAIAKDTMIDWTKGKHWSFVYFAGRMGPMKSHGEMIHDHPAVQGQPLGLRQAQFQDKETCDAMHELVLQAETINKMEHGNTSDCTFTTYWKPEP